MAERQATTIGALLLQDILPDPVRHRVRELNKDSVKEILAYVADNHPEKYREVLKRFYDVGRSAAYTEGLTVSLSSLRQSKAKQPLIEEARQRAEAIIDDKRIPDNERAERLGEALRPYIKKIQQAVVDEAKAENSPYALQVTTGARGSPSDLSSLKGADVLVNDQNDRTLGVPILRSYSEGLSPAEWWATTYGQRRGAVGVKFCLSGDTLVKMCDGTAKRIQDVQVGDRVFGSDLHGVLRPVAVKAVYDNGVRDCYEYTFQQGLRDVVKLVATPDHELLTVLSGHSQRSVGKTPRKRRLREAPPFGKKTNPYVALAPQGADAVPGYEDARAMFLGLMLGDGCTSPSAKRSWAFSIDDDLLEQEVSPYFAAAGFGLGGRPSAGYTRTVKSLEPHAFLRDGVGRVNSSSHPTKIWFDELGLTGAYSHTKRLPADVWLWSSSALCDLLGGIFSTDGSVSYRRSGASIYLSMTSREIIHTIRDLLLFRFGIYAPPPTAVKMRDNMRHPQWRLVINFASSVARMRDTLTWLGAKRVKLAACNIKPARYKAGFRLIASQPVGEQRTYDIEVDHEDHLFCLSNGLIVGNSTGDAGFMGKKLINAAHRIVVNKDTPPATRLPVGLIVDAADKENVGSVLAYDIGPYKAGQRITPDMLDTFKDEGVDKILVHSALTEPSEDGGISRFAAGKREKRDLSPIGDNIGIAAAQAISERISQGMLNCLAAGTLVRMADGSTRPIEALQVGDLVLGSDVNGTVKPTRVTRTYDHGEQPCYHYISDCDHCLGVVCTTEHKFLTRSAKSEVDVTPIGQSLNSLVGLWITDDVSWHKVVCSGYEGYRPVYDIEVDHPDHLFVLANGLIVSNSKHTAGAGSSDRVSRSGFEYLSRLVEAPETFPEAGPLVPEDSTVDDIREAPQGGHYVTVGGKQLYVHPDLDVTVKKGQRLSAGDPVSNGIPHPRELVRYHGLGEARRQYLYLLKEALEGSGIKAHRRNLEPVVAGLMQWARVTNPDGVGDHIVDDVVSYNRLAATYTPRAQAPVALSQSRGLYLEEPALHYSVGTRITDRVSNDLKRFGIKDVLAHQDPPDFEPYFQPAIRSVTDDEDWQTRLSGFYAADAFKRSVQRGMTSDPDSTSYVPAIARATNFGKNLKTKGTYGG